ncbi:tRNA 5-methoxyuridine(34)/uridine 5-oxyacetic acid(34) synthase CmoB [Thiomicrorhabdus sp. ZW0627]|uniref:tRNA 5-methoxyuridine(34)/uridine 5-oxyacetic acid(34) synthase CmoB n=1 Tax=Thiomicrorhabdus sp. ZW0627 TaxID=3039774 RepID=UPI002436FA67|nr:tRNA 5-methoxyuridine(34)/uridine 5-oxyacetic acid(34) synthase CmoB [Thiomicrorhabdus sp. ZW0627]MDG6774203.1 tRNA 5-methoxyuridine(34)/uridine 5-oxyacetic acid(34) synthase CmoB [Thiomicrorhabdus sp. ZW0627]
MKQHYDTFWEKLGDSRFDEWNKELPDMIDHALHPEGNGNLPRWLAALEIIHDYPRDQISHLNQSVVTVGEDDLDDGHKHQLESALRVLMPWRKGPFSIHGIHIETEWHSDWKWDRVRPHLAALEGKRVLDIGCGSGYHLWRMAAENTKLAVGVDPSLLFMSQFLTLKHFIGESVPAYFLPLTLEALPVSPKGGAFDTVFSMGVLYHRRSPIDHIYELKNQLVAGGELVLETLVVPEEFGQLLVPEDRYAQMRNVWFLPSVSELQRWMERCGFINVRCVDIDQTSIEEQRSTDWMQWNSLKDFLDPDDLNKTVEGYPAPLRAVMVANKPK